MEEKVIKKIVSAMGTINEINVYYNGRDNKKDVLDEMEDYLLDIDKRWSIFLDSSEVSFINKNAYLKDIEVENDTYELLKLSKDFGKLTNGAFDITVCELSRYWKNIIKSGEDIDDEIIKSYLDNYSYRDIYFGCNYIRFKKNFNIDLGGIAKGYVLNKIIEKFNSNKINNYLINLGGSVASFGEERFIGIRNPFTSIERRDAESFIRVKVKNKCVVTSGIYEQCLLKNNKLYHHIISPFTGYSVESDLVSVTLVGGDACMLDCLATSTFIMGIEESFKIFKKNNIECIIVLRDGNVFISDGLKEKVEFIGGNHEKE